ncbi:MAG: DNA mismatch repair endonuclease MutL [Thermodesulfovibrionia bacterium]
MITILSESLINKIAAGEVIDRPASVVRELIDNSIDADATKIDIEVLYGGKRLIRVSDNGIGMNRDDAILSLERHATSKIKTEDDLFRLSTLGFRGEALPAIASVSKLVITTSPVNDRIGTRVEVLAGGSREVRDAPPINGTVVEVRDIFYNTPARRKFLKGVSTELSHIIDIVTQRALAYPDIAFSLLHNNNELLNVQLATNIRERFLQVYGDEFVEGFIEVENEADGIKVYGFISPPMFIRDRRSHQFIFINKRAIKNPLISHAIYSGYGERLPRGRHPSFFLFIEIEPSKVDVNVHPAKMEVRFESSQDVYQCVERAVYIASHPRDVMEYKPIVRETPSVGEDLAGWSLATQTGFFTTGGVALPQRYFPIGDSFIASVTDKGLMIIDQHAVHERILYERLLKKAEIVAEPLFLPLRIELPNREHNILLNHKELLKCIGFEIGDFGGRDIIVKAIPRELKKADIREILIDIASGILEEVSDGREELLKRVCANLACHRSVRGREQLNNEEIISMLSELEGCSEPDRCPHGRPTRVILSMEDLRRMFKR